MMNERMNEQIKTCACIIYFDSVVVALTFAPPQTKSECPVKYHILTK